ncbi:MAG TPA: adenylate/guanylate cyclase domain-containing protein [Verrucomicrobiae bacterium]|nr:adenylate/guanylate cyclase domain-containing protein [Verrucomicrobiae bacterium]
MSLRASWSWELAAPRARLWEYLADTDWVNEHAGLPKITARYSPVDGGGSRRFAWFRKGPVLFEWEERPTIWQVPQYFAVDRLYTKGPLARFLTSTRLVEIDAGHTRVEVAVELRAATPLTEPLLPLVAAQGKRGAARAFRLAEQLAAKPRELAPPRALGAFARLQGDGVPGELIAALAAFVENAQDRDLARMRPYELADRWRLSRRGVLRAFLSATRRGLFNLSWNVICPGCRGPSPAIEALGDLQAGYHCPACNVPFDAVFDRSVEVTFDAKPLGRAKDVGLFCIASPQRSPHVFAQLAVGAEEERGCELALQPGVYDVNAMGVGLAPFVVSTEEQSGAIDVFLHPLTGVDVTHAVAPGTQRVTIVNERDAQTIVRIEDGRWPDTIVTAAAVTALQEFRDLFSSQVLAPGLQLGIETIAVLFTDLIGSTAMYTRTGDASAFRIVADHFDVVRDIVDRYEGAVVKTIGDAVMAVFTDPARCLDAAMELDASVSTISARGEPLRMRVGFHAGPCIAMRANDRIDYFGTTVNLAARLQSKAGAGEVTLSRSTAEIPRVAARLRALGQLPAYEHAGVKGLREPVEILRLHTQLQPEPA